MAWFSIFDKIWERLFSVDITKKGDFRQSKIKMGKVNAQNVIIYQVYGERSTLQTAPIEEPVDDAQDNKIKIVLGNSLGLVQSSEIIRQVQTRIQLEGAVSSEYERPKIIRDMQVQLNGDYLYFKTFFQFTDNGDRAPLLKKRFPIVIAANGVWRFDAEFEATGISLPNDIIRGEIFVEFEDDKIAKTEFEFSLQDPSIVKSIVAAKELTLERHVPSVVQISLISK